MALPLPLYLFEVQQAVTQSTEFKALQHAIDAVLAKPELGSYARLTSTLSSPGLHASMTADPKAGLVLGLTSQVWLHRVGLSTNLVAPIPRYAAAVVRPAIIPVPSEPVIPVQAMVPSVEQTSTSAFQPLSKRKRKRSSTTTLTNRDTWMFVKTCGRKRWPKLHSWLSESTAATLPRCGKHLPELEQCAIECRKKYWIEGVSNDALDEVELSL